MSYKSTKIQLKKFAELIGELSHMEGDDIIVCLLLSSTTFL